MNTELPKTELTGGGLLARNSIINLGGQVAPAVVAIFAIPLLIHGLGTARFGVLTLIWMVIGYFSLFDLGLGRALTQIVAEKLGRGENEQIPALVWTAVAMMFALGAVGACIVAAISPWLVYSVLRIPPILQGETQNALYLLAATIPFVLVIAALGGILSALQRFALLNAIRVPSGMYSFLGPLLVLPFGKSIFVVTAILSFGRIVACLVHFIACLRVMPTLWTGFALDSKSVKPLFHLGGWMTVSNVIGPILLYLDRFIIGGVISVTAVAYYATPYEMVTKLWILPSAMVGVLFPAFASSYAANHDRMILLFERGTKYVALAVFPCTLIISTFAHEGLKLWLGEDFAVHSAPVLQIFSVGVFLTSLAIVFMAHIQGIGKPHLSAKLHLLELPIYVVALWWAIHHFGIMGAALAWTGRAAFDCFGFFWLSSRYIRDKTGLIKRMFFAIILATISLALPAMFAAPGLRMAIGLLLAIGFVYLAWQAILDSGERLSIKARLGSV